VRLAHELAVSNRQLVRWRSQGLLPTPQRRGRGRGRGAAADYPQGVLTQLSALVQMREAGVRDANQLRVGLWLEGHQVDVQRVRADLIDALPMIELPEDEDAALDNLDSLASAAGQNLARQRRSAIDRRRLPGQADQHTALFQLLASSLVESHQVELTDPLDDDTEKTLGEVLERADGTHPAREARTELSPWLDGPPGDALVPVLENRWLNLGNLRASLASASIEELGMARDTYCLLTAAGELLRASRQLGHTGENEFGLRSFEFLNSRDLRLTASVLAALLLVVQDGFGQQLSELTTAIDKACAVANRALSSNEGSD